MVIASWILFGILSGIFAHRFDPQARGGLIGALLLGVLGAMEGGFLARFLFNGQPGDINPTVIFMEIMGAIVILLSQRMLSKFPQQPV